MTYKRYTSAIKVQTLLTNGLEDGAFTLLFWSDGLKKFRVKLSVFNPENIPVEKLGIRAKTNILPRLEDEYMVLFRAGKRVLKVNMKDPNELFQLRAYVRRECTPEDLSISVRFEAEKYGMRLR